jgi:hypothetical protein
LLKEKFVPLLNPWLNKPIPTICKLLIFGELLTLEQLGMKLSLSLKMLYLKMLKRRKKSLKTSKVTKKMMLKKKTKTKKKWQKLKKEKNLKENDLDNNIS